MKQSLVLIFLMLLQFTNVHAMVDFQTITMQPKEEEDIGTPIKRSPATTPKIGLNGKTLIRLQAKNTTIYNVEILQNGEVVYSSAWDFQNEELILPNTLTGEYDILLSNGTKTFVGTFWID